MPLCTATLIFQDARVRVDSHIVVRARTLIAQGAIPGRDVDGELCRRAGRSERPAVVQRKTECAICAGSGEDGDAPHPRGKNTRPTCTHSGSPQDHRILSAPEQQRVRTTRNKNVSVSATDVCVCESTGEISAQKERMKNALRGYESSWVQLLHMHFKQRCRWYWGAIYPE